MKQNSSIIRTIPAAILLTCCLAWAPAYSQATDNSGQNKDHSATADNQSNAKSDRDTTADIRKAVIADKDLSMYAHNVKIITRNGHVTLKGPVKSEQERQQVLTDASSVVAKENIDDQLTVKE
jgi:osmotically-inducible protein OsmY